MSRRNSSIELMRLLACLSVIAIHVGMPAWLNGEVELPALTVACVTGDAVAVFFSITGCFWFTSAKGFGRSVLDFLRGILLPALLTVLASSLLADWLKSPGFAPVLSSPDWSSLWQGLIHLNADLWPAICGHLWYVFVMGELLLARPIVRLFVQKKLHWPLYLLMAGDLLLRLLQELSLLNPDWGWRIPVLPYAFPALAEMLLGWFLWQRREQLAKKKWLPLAGAAGFLAVTALRVWVQQGFYLRFGYGLMQYWNRSFSLLILLSLYCVFLPLKLPERLGQVICRLAACSFGVYLIHVAVIEKLTYLPSPVPGTGCLIWLQAFFASLTGSLWMNRLLYALFSALLIFAICAVPVFLWQLTRRKVASLWKKVGKS